MSWWTGLGDSVPLRLDIVMSSSYLYGIPTGSGNPPQHLQESSKKALQKQYRDRESELFQQLQDSIRGFTDQNPTTRHEILREGRFYSFAMNKLMAHFPAVNLLATLHNETTQMMQQLPVNPLIRGNGTNYSGTPFSTSTGEVSSKSWWTFPMHHKEIEHQLLSHYLGFQRV
ncbi:hypothetical protein J3A83DRAFT_4298096 [Scleroderma citrinum]